ncbi:hypothetical protein [Bacillus bingmayongensis]|uniref:hypothetical protein n=1 Tax=Bacillus bingmayongensis TaxID=1150157 RepID=UPI0002D71167|nr:hypothetical protein [Bacillus bingmayongensis]
MRSGQLTFDDLLGTFDYKAKSTAEQFLKCDPAVKTYEVHFYDKDERQKIDWFDVESEKEAWEEAKLEHGRSIQKIGIFKSKRTRAEIMALD